MNSTDIAGIRTGAQHIAGTRLQSVRELVGWMGVMQAQDYAMSKWAVGIRLPGATLKEVDTAIDKGEIIRTHLLRPTWHLVSADDIHWMLDLSADRIRAAAKPYLKQLELSAQILSKCNNVLESVLAGNRHLTRKEIMAELVRAGIPTDSNRSSLILMQAELDGLVCSGATKANSPTYALLHERVPITATITKDEALARLAKRYFNSHCPATLKDFTWWSGLSAADARHALEMIKHDLISETMGAQIFWLPASFSAVVKTKQPSVYLLPAFDEFIISYADRSASLNNENHKKYLLPNGFFRPVIIVNGQVTGLWKRKINSNALPIEIEYLKPHGKKLQSSVVKAAKVFGQFLGLKPELSFLSETPDLIPGNDG